MILIYIYYVSFILIKFLSFTQVAALGKVLGSLSNPLLVLPLKPSQTTASPVFSPPVFSGVRDDVETDEPKLSNLVGAGYQAFEDSVLEKMKKV